MAKWNNSDAPVAFLITFRTYGTWLAGDERGSIDKYHNVYGGPRSVDSPKRKAVHRERLKSPPYVLNAKARKAVEDAIREVCRYREWNLFAIAVRTNHCHVVIYGNVASSKILNDIKAYSTKKLREVSEWDHEHSPWSAKGSLRNLWIEDHINFACQYVDEGQGKPLPEFD